MIVSGLRHRAENPREREKGFSAIEMAATVAIILVVVGVAIPVVNNALAAYKLRSAVSAITGTIQATRYQAIYQGYSYQVVFDATGKTYQVQNKVPGATGFSNVGTAASWSDSLEQITLNASTTLTFSPSGKVQLGGGAGSCPCTMTLSYPGRPSELITVSSFGDTNVTP